MKYKLIKIWESSIENNNYAKNQKFCVFLFVLFNSGYIYIFSVTMEKYYLIVHKFLIFEYK